MNAEPLNKEIYNKAITMGITKITLNFSGGNDEGSLNVELTPYTDENGNDKNEFTRRFDMVSYSKLTNDIENWAWDVYSYSGAGEGNDYGDDIVYDLVNKTVSTSEWFTERQYGDSGEHTMEFADEDVLNEDVAIETIGFSSASQTE